MVWGTCSYAPPFRNAPGSPDRVVSESSLGRNGDAVVIPVSKACNLPENKAPAQKGKTDEQVLHKMTQALHLGTCLALWAEVQWKSWKFLL